MIERKRRAAQVCQQISRRELLRLLSSGTLFLPAIADGCQRLAACETSRLHGIGDQDIGDGGPAIAAILERPSGLAIDSAGDLYIAERGGHRVRRVDAKSGIISTIAGTGDAGFSGDAGPAVEAQLSSPESLVIDSKNSLFVSDHGNARVRCIDLESGLIQTVAGTGETGYSGDGDAAEDAQLKGPYGLAIDGDDNLYIADTNNHVIRRLVRKTSRIVTVAGNGLSGFSGDGASATDTRLSRPHCIAIDPQGRLLIGDSRNQRIRQVDLETGSITTLYGNGEFGVSEDGILASDASFAFFGSLLFNPGGDLLIAGWVDQRIRLVDAKTGIITTLVGTGEPGNSPNGTPATKAAINGPYEMAIDKPGNVYFCDFENNQVRRVDAKTKVVNTIAGAQE